MPLLESEFRIETHGSFLHLTQKWVRVMLGLKSLGESPWDDLRAGVISEKTG